MNDVTPAAPEGARAGGGKRGPRFFVVARVVDRAGPVLFIYVPIYGATRRVGVRKSVRWVTYWPRGMMAGRRVKFGRDDE